MHSFEQQCRSAAHPTAGLPRLQANFQRRRSRSPGRGTSPAAAPPPGPWLSGRSSAQDSKHLRSRSGSPGLQPRPKVGRRLLRPALHCLVALCGCRVSS